MIGKVTINNFKCLRAVQVELEPFTVFVGPNASGKSSILQALDLLCRAFRPQDVNVEAELLRAMSRGVNGVVELLAKSDETWYRYRTRDATLSANPPFGLPGQWAGNGPGVISDLARDKWEFWRAEPAGPVGPPLSVLLRLEASKLVQPNPAPDLTVMAPDGLGLHSALASMALNDPDSWQALQADLRRIIPTIRRLRHTKPANVHQPAALLFDTVGADSIPAAQVSEGTLLVLGLLTALHAAGRPNLVLLDDLDRGLHPKAQKELISLLRGVLATSPDLQILGTTHSPYMLDSMSPNEVRMTCLGDDGSTVCAPLASHPKFEKWKDEMAPGEMWSLFGEKWVVEQKVAS